MTTGPDPTAKPFTAFRFVGRCLLSGALGLCLTAAAIAADSTGNVPGGWGIEQLMQRLSQVKVARGTFVERKELGILNAPLESSGTLIYTAPGRLEKNTLRPRPESLVLDEHTLTIEDKARKRRRTLSLQENPVIWAFVESIRSTLAGDLQSLNRFYRVTLEGPEQNWRLTLQPREARMESVVREIDITGSRNLIRFIEIYEPRGDRSIMTITGTAQ